MWMIRPIIFLSKCLCAAKRNYWATELVIGALVWGISKLRHYLDGNIFADHMTIYALFEALRLAYKKE